ncbi:recombinase family protein [Actinoplanes sp. NPDC049596]|uniref:recombinase family protein n=1 Tax=unclassified Actinoplanes TaxID=2626549 RepID=UPI00341BBEED
MRASTYGRQSSNKAKSIAEQLEAGTAAKEDNGWEDAGDYTDGRSASRYANPAKRRGGWAELLATVSQRDIDAVILWESSRGDRTLATWAAFLDSCRDNGVSIHVITHDMTYDLSNARHYKVLAEDGVASHYETDLLSIRTRRGHAGAAKAGLPPGGPTPYGYKRTFDPNTGKRLGQVVSIPESLVVQRIFKDISKGEPILKIAESLSKPSDPWTPSRVRGIARNPVYVALRRHNGQEYAGQWEPIVDKKLFYDVQQVLSSPDRRITRPGRQKHLLSYLGRCDVCGDHLDHVKDSYRCSNRRKHCVQIQAAPLEAVIERLVVTRLQQPDALAALVKPEGVQNMDAIKGDLAEARSRLQSFRQGAINGTVSIETLSMAETQLAQQISDLETQLKAATVPPALRDMAGPDAQERWNAATLTARRSVVQTLCEIRVGKGGAGTRYADKQAVALKRLSGSRWAGDSRTWGQVWV